MDDENFTDDMEFYVKPNFKTIKIKVKIKKMKVFKTGDKVKIPKQSTAKIANFKCFLQEMSNYKLDYLIVRTIDNSGYWEVSLERNDGINLFEDGFNAQDLEHYEEYNPTFNPETHSSLIIDFDTVETIEEIAQRHSDQNHIIGDFYKLGFIAGVKWYKEYLQNK